MRDKTIEVMGLMLGEVRTWKGQTYVLVRDVVTSDLDATSVSVKFDSGGMEKLFGKLDDVGFDYVIVGWYHSHPGYGCFMSETDLATHSSSFVSPYQLAMVIDPKNMDVGVFRMRDGKAVPEDFAVYWDEYDDPYGGLKRMPRA
jgi:proteasome lid subunit RPN8/RPN11